MLSHLSIQNFALIETADLSFEKGFTVITGETGSGKSILLGALNLMLGERADYGVIRNPEVKTIVEGTFELTAFGLESFFESKDLDFSPQTVIRREISAQGRSRAFVNDTPVSLTDLKELSERLIHIHSQHHTIQLKNPQFQLELLDDLAEAQELRRAVQDAFFRWKKISQELEYKRAQRAKQLLDADYNAFQLQELQELGLDVWNFDELQQELEAFEHGEQIRETFGRCVQAIDGELGIQSQLASLKNQLEKNRHFHSVLNDLFERVQSAAIELQDIANDAENQLSKLDLDPERFAVLTERLDAYHRVLRKHGLTNSEELRALQAKLEQANSSTEQLESEIVQLEEACSQIQVELTQATTQLNEQRKQRSSVVAARITDVLEELKMPQTRLDFDLKPTGKLDEFGGVQLTILFSPNAGLAPKPIEKAASGGELSRLMLAIQLLLSEKKQLPTLILDEIDTGVSGEVAQKIGVLLQSMGRHMQLFAISHLPQVAAKGNNHWKVAKNSHGGSTSTEILVLNHDERIAEIARLMSGDTINEAAMQNALALMNP